MCQSVYKSKQCAFHPKQIISNFCKNIDCLLPLCPTCVDLHSDEHKQQKTYGKFQNINQVVNDLIYNLQNNTKQLDNFSDDIKDQLSKKNIDEQVIRRQIGQAKQRVIGLVQRFFNDFEKQVNKSILQFNISMKQTYRQMQNQISSIKSQIQLKIQNLGSDKVLKTIIAYYSKQQQKKLLKNLQSIKQTLNITGNKRTTLLIQNNSIQKMINQLSQFMYLSFQNWEQDIKYGNDFVKTGFTTSRSEFSKSYRKDQI